jgi:hypothetical protein
MACDSRQFKSLEFELYLAKDIQFPHLHIMIIPAVGGGYYAVCEVSE